MGAAVVFVLLNTAILLFALGAVIHGRRGMRQSKAARRNAAWLVSLIHMTAGVLILGCYGLVALLYILLS